MNGNSKSEKIDTLVRQIVREALADIALYGTAEQANAARLIHREATINAGRAASRPYRVQEFVDICAWKKGPKSK